MQNWFAFNVHDINNDFVIELVVVFEGKFESSGWCAMHLALLAEFCKFLDALMTEILSGLFENLG